MSYSQGHPVRPIGGRLVLDFLNTADWSEQGGVVHEKLLSLDDLRRWANALGVGSAALPDRIQPVWSYRTSLRAAFGGPSTAPADGVLLGAWLGQAPDAVTTPHGDGPLGLAPGIPLLTIVTWSALAVLSEPRDMARLKRCPGTDCGWLFVDETKNGRRRWCSMETCGNRAKARRHYAREKAAAP